MSLIIASDDGAGGSRGRRARRRGRRGDSNSDARAAVTLSTAPTISQCSSTVDSEDLDTTPRVLRVTNPDSSKEDGSVSSRETSKSRQRFSLRSISNSLSSIWRSEGRSCSHVDSSQDPVPGCGSFSSLFAGHQPLSRTLKKKSLTDENSRVSWSWAQASSLL